MRLIDADEVKKVFFGNRYGTKAIEYVIDDAPTVKAITVKWIKNWLLKTETKERYICFDIRDMLDDWEKENE